MTLLMKCIQTSNVFALIDIYDPQKSTLKCELWCQILGWVQILGYLPYIIGGDFNIIKHLGEREGGSRKLKTNSNDFNNFIDQLHFLESF